MLFGNTTIQTNEVQAMSENWLITIDCRQPALNPDNKLYVSVPGELVCSLEAALPPLPAKNREQVMGYAIEDQIATHLDEVKLFSNPRSKSSLTPILWCLRTHWGSWLQKIEKMQDHPPEAMLPDYLYLPLEDNAWSIRSISNRTLLRCSQSTGLTIETNSFVDLLSLQLDNTKTKPESIIYDGVDLTEALKKICRQHSIPFIHKKLRLFEAPLQAMPSMLPKKKWHWKKTKANLLKRLENPWKTAARLTGIWLVILIVGSAWYEVSLSNAVERGKEQLTTLYHRLDMDPTQGNASDHLRQLHDKLKNTIYSDENLRQLKRVGEVVERVTGIKVTRFDVSAHGTTVTVSAPSIAVLAHFMHELKLAHIVAKQSNLIIDQQQASVTLTLGDSF
jgi:type II secretion system protein L